MIYFVQLTILNIKDFFLQISNGITCRYMFKLTKKASIQSYKKKIVTKLFSKNRKILS